MMPMANTRRLNGYDPAATLARPAARRVAWLTGQSSYRHAQLSPAQADLLRAATPPAWQALYANFPYHPGALQAAYRPAPLLAASVRNNAQFVAALGSAAFRRACARHLQPLLDATTGRLALLCGSCGLQLFYSVLPLLRVPPGLRVQLLGLGPVCLTPQPHPQVSVAVVQGRRDWLSRGLCRLPCDWPVPGGHLAYTAQPALIPVVNAWLLGAP